MKNHQVYWWIFICILNPIILKNILNNKKVFIYNYNDIPYNYETYIYKYTLEKPKEKTSNIKINKIENNTTILGKNAIIGNDNDNSKKTTIELSPTIKLPNSK